jgi:hypothetical protein
MTHDALAGSIRRHSMVRTGTRDIGPDDSGGGRLYGDGGNDVDQDPVRSLHDTEEEAGDEVGITDTYRVDAVEAEQMHVDLDPVGGQEAELY